jgi:hypothetical protein
MMNMNIYYPFSTGRLYKTAGLRLLAVLCLVVLLTGCTSHKKVVSWRDKNAQRNSIGRTLVIFITEDKDSLLRKTIENSVVATLNKDGYNALSSLSEYGQKGLLMLEQEQTYISLCNKGIDAVLTIALLDNHKSIREISPSDKRNNLYYYRRIWKYKTDFIKQDSLNRGILHNAFIETILFDLSTLAPLYWAQTKPFDAASTNYISGNVVPQILKEVRKTGVLSKNGIAKELGTF